MRDKIQKARGNHARGENSGSVKHPECLARGEKQGSAKLTAEKVRQAREIYSFGGHCFAELGVKFGVSAAGIRNAIRGKTWAHVGVASDQVQELV